ncbi:phosphate acyltransferase PlsX [soil metagenome]
MNIAIDAMGGDFAPGNVVGGVRQALEKYGQIEMLYLVGDEATVRAELDRQRVPSRKITLVHSTQVVEMGDSAALAVRRKKDSSIAVAVDLVKAGTCAGVVSAGHTGAAVAATTLKLRTLAGIDRAGIASPFPNENGVCHLIDAGANVDSRPIHLFQHAVMGSVYARHVLGKQNPAIGLMSNGEEDSKGNEVSKETFKMLKDSPLNFRGNVEGRDLFQSPLDVVVCDGFVGNVLLKGCEATAKTMFKWLREEIHSTPFRKLGALMAKGAFRATYKKGNYESYGGSPLLGVNGICIIAHGSSSVLAMENAIRVAVEAVAHGVNPHIEEAIANLGQLAPA